MGNNNSSKKRQSRRGRLSVCEVTRIVDSLDGSCNTDLSKGVSVEVVKTLWREELVPSLLVLYQEELFPLSGGRSRKSVEEFAELYVSLARGDAAERARAIARVLMEPKRRQLYLHEKTRPEQHLEPILLASLVKYVSDVLESYLRGIERRRTREFLSWQSATSTAKENVFNVARCWCVELESDSSEVSLDDLELWVARCGVMSLLHKELMTALYNLESDEMERDETSDERIALLPVAMNTSDTAVTHSVLDLAHILHLNYLLHQDYQRQWRPLFSTGSHGESFSMLVGKIAERGPTIIVVEDEAGHVFGGVTSHSWLVSPKFQGDSTCFLFTLRPLVSVFHATGFNDHFMYLNQNQQTMPNGLGMGGQHNYWGFWLDAEFGKGKCSESCTTFSNYKTMSANREFTIKHLEVWGVGPAPLSAEDKGERPGILVKDPTARCILEMAGKTQHSAGMKELDPK
ncbi:MTOR-associated protein MEAK7 isoform X2 [Nilaparvata lugens]|uniref:MTOR-associated protein MEAK7 isoform X1 n=1 Tax=Nilaparvata lugens TaxID=108931 RepID=UPI000B986A7F|nr:MTOR-associated protein MEAK7 isoform X1 [Nilaparvata lugens]XP_039276398.1 MTOR-associated protein MEAK7 isoform X2 [Nilaparvata lugens]